MNNKRFGLSKRLIFLLCFLFAIAVLILNLRNITDYIKLYGYVPSTEVEQLADETSMTDSGRRLFYINHATVAEKGSFNQYCNSQDQNSIVLGCYHPVDRGIYLFRVTDPRLTGVEQVTAAHEMLHAAYDRLSGNERKRIDDLLVNFYQTSVTDQRIKDTIAAYEKSEPNDVVNEMHSIFPTEIATLPAELEAYYQKYFSDRAKVVGYASNYQTEFTSRRDQVKSYDERLVALKAEIEFNSQSLKAQENTIVTMQARMNTDKANEDFAAYNAQVPIYNARIGQYNSLITETQALITQYNQLVNERNSVALEVKDLAKSIDSRLTPIDQ